MNALGAAYCRIDKEEKGLNMFKRVLEIDNTFAEAYHNRGLHYMSKNKLDEALEEFNKAISLKF